MGGGENSLEDQLWRSSLGLSSGGLKEGKEVRDDDSLGTSGHSWGHLLPQSAPRQIRFGASLLKCSLLIPLFKLSVKPYLILFILL